MYQASGMLTQIFHVFDHLNEAATHVARVESQHAEGHRSRRKLSVVDEVAAMQSNKSVKAFNKGFNLNSLSVTKYTSAEKHHMIELAVFRQPGEKCT